MVAGQIGESGVVAVRHVVVAFKHAHELAPTLPLDLVVPIAKGITYSPKLAILMAAQVSVG